MNFIISTPIKKVVFFSVIFLFAFTISSYSQCNYQRSETNGVVLKQFSPMPIGGNDNKQLALCISNVDNKNILMVIVRFRYERIAVDKAVKIGLTNGKTISLIADDYKFERMGGSNITIIKIGLSQTHQVHLLDNNISYVMLNGNEEISAKMNSGYIAQNLKCFK